MKLITKTTPVTHEDLFIERYEQLFLWALQMTGSDRELAEDLVQDAFIQFTFTRPDVHAIQHLDAYLYGLLRNLHVSQVRRSARNRLQPFSLVEYESAEMSLRAADIRDQIKAQDELRQICHYACVRKESSWAGSVLILRFFHGYYPSEIAKVLRTTRQSVDERLRIARSEAKLSLSNPESLSFMKDSATVLFGHTGFARKIDDFLVELRQMIFHSQHGLCFSSRQLQALYRSREAAPMKSEDLGHIVSCPTCLDAVNKLLGLPLLAGRYPTDTIGRDRRDKGDKGGGGDEGGSGGAAKSRVIDRWRRRAREAFEHRPKELHISVNGLLQGSQKINSELNEQTLDVDMTEQIGFVEVFTDLGIRLLILNVDEPPPRGQVEQSTRVDLSDNRSLDLKLRFDSPWPTLQVAYVDPLMRPEAATQLAEVTGTTLAVERPQTGAKGLLPKAGLRNVGSRLLSLVIRRRFWLRPGTVTALLALVLIAAVLFIELKRAPSPPLTAAILLRQSSAAEEAAAARTDEVLHRTITLEEKTASGVLIARRKIEVWHSAERGITARRLYDERGSLVAGDWRRADGVQTIYHHGSRPLLQLPPEKRDGSALVFDNAWELDPSASEFTSLIGRVDEARVEERSGDYVISYASAWSTNLHGLVKATLILSRADLHPVEQTLVIQQGSEQREYHFVEAGFERRQPTGVAPAVFDPDPELLLEKPKDEGTRTSDKTNSVSRLPVLPASSIATPELEVEVLRLLNQAGADTGEQVSLTRTPAGQLRIEGIIDTDARKAEILRTLAPVATNQAVIIDINTIAEALEWQAQKSKRTASGPTPTPRVSEVTTAGDTFPAYSDLRKRFSDEEARRFASQMVNRSDQALRHAGALKQLANRFSPEAIQSLDPDAQAKFIALLQSHAVAFQNETIILRRELRTAFPDAPPATGESPGRITNAQELLDAIRTLFELGVVNDRTVRAAFSISSGTTNTAIKSPQFYQSLLSAEKLAEEIQRTKLNAK